MTGLTLRLVDTLDDGYGRGIYELAAMFGVENDRMLRALWDAQRRGDVVPMIIDGYVWWFVVPGTCPAKLD